MRFKWLIGTLSVVIAAVVVYGVMALFARPAPNHPFFATEKPGIQVIAHRGGADLSPENTLTAFAHAVAIGADVLEMDIRASGLASRTDGIGR